VTCSFGDLDDRIGGNGAAARAALLVEKVHDFPQGIGIGRIPQKSALAAHVDKADLFQLFQVVRKGGCRDGKFFLDLACNHTFGMGGKKQSQNLQTGLSAEGGKAVGGAGDQEWIRFANNSIIAEIWKDVKRLFVGNVPWPFRILLFAPPKLWKRPRFRF